jgi:hypothetical protein
MKRITNNSLAQLIFYNINQKMEEFSSNGSATLVKGGCKILKDGLYCIYWFPPKHN